MSKATLPFQNRIALVFDFDETLAPDTFSALLEHLDIDPEWFATELVDPRADDGWDHEQARMYSLLEETKRRNVTITPDTFKEVGEKLELYPEVETMFERVRKFATDVAEDIEVEFYLLTAGMLEIPKATSIADNFRMMWGGEIHFNDEGEYDFIKRTVDYPDKSRYLLKLCKGLNIDNQEVSNEVFKDKPDDEWHVPINQIVFVGDGASDMPAFSFMYENDGLAIGVFQAESVDEWDGYEDMREDRRVQNLAPSNYEEDSELMQSLRFAVESIAKRICLLRLGKDE